METLRAGPLLLEPLVVAHAGAMFAVLRDPELYRHLDYPPPPSIEHLQSVYAKLEARQSPDGSQRWLNWVVRPAGQQPVGYVQATVTLNRSAWVAYVLAKQNWGAGYATLATQSVMDHLQHSYAVEHFLATVEVENQRSIGVLQRLGFAPASASEASSHKLSATEHLFVK